VSLSAAEGRVKIIVGDCRDSLAALPESSVDCIVTSPPYFGLRDYGCGKQIGLEPSPHEFVSALVDVFRLARRVLTQDGTCWINLGDSYAATTKGSSGLGKNASNRGPIMQERRWRIPEGNKPKDLLMIPARAAIALCDDGWWLRSDIIWHKPNPMPESVTDRPTKAHEHVFLLTKAQRYFYDAAAIKEPARYPGDFRATRADTRKSIEPMCLDGGSRSRTGTPTSQTINARTVWTIATEPCEIAHFALMPTELARRCVLAGCSKGGVVLDPFGGGGTTGLVAARHGRRAILCELNPEYAAIAKRRIDGEWKVAAPQQVDEPGPLFAASL